MTKSQPPTVLVGVDGSECGAEALEWAVAYARATGAHLQLVIAWHWPVSYGAAMAWEGWNPDSDAQAVLDKAQASVDLPAERVRGEVHQGDARDVLVDLSTAADLLVIGTRGHGNVTGAMLGSVSNYCAHHAHCPVVIVRR